ncbi:MAG TPA: PASTA domain-containing protein [Terriglobales bacterium]|nr:PASTA domain-containing protein [Terriglobales bacterium]
MKAFFRFVVLALILIAVALISALTAMRVAIHGGEVNVPNLSKLIPAEAERISINSGLLTVVDGQFYSATIPEGHVVSQSPAAGTRVRRGYCIHLAESLGPQRTTIPDVVGQSSRAADLNLRERGLDVGTVAVAHLPNVPEDQVAAQSPPGNSTSAESPTISLLVGAEPEKPAYVMPNMVGRNVDDATALIDHVGLKVEVRTVPATPAPPASAVQLLGPFAPPPAPPTLPTTPTVSPAATSAPVPNLVVHQSPAPGQKITAETVIQLDVSR